MLCNTEFESLGSDFVSICLCVMSLCVMSHVSLCLSSLMSPVSHVSHVGVSQCVSCVSCLWGGSSTDPK